MMTWMTSGRIASLRSVGFGWPLRLAALAFGAAWAGGVLPGAVAAQDVTVGERQECRCVDRDGNEIENCTCIRVPRMQVMAPMIGGMMDRRARIGVYIDTEQSEEAGARGGAVLSEVVEDSPADRAGLRAGDIVLRVDGHRLTEPLEDREAEERLDLERSVAVQRFVRLVGDLEPGEPAEFEVLRDGVEQTVTVTPETAFGSLAVRVGEAPTIFMRGGEFRFEGPDSMEMERMRDLEGRLWRERMRAPEGRMWSFELPEGDRVIRLRGDSLGGRSGFSFFGGDPCVELAHARGEGLALLAGAGRCIDGVEFLELNPDLAAYFDAESGGVLVTEVAEDSALGLRAGDVLQAIDGREVRDPDHARRIIASYEMDEEIRLRVLRQGREVEVLGRRRDG